MKKITFQQNKKIFNKKGVLILFLFLFIVLKIYLAIQTASVGERLSRTEKKSNLLVKENREKQSQLIKLTSLMSLENKAQELGYLNDPQKLFIKIDESSVSILR